MMRALSLHQPWAQLIAVGAKKIETRSWATSYRGLVAIQAAKGIPQSARDLMHEHPAFTSALRPHGYTSSTQLPVGAIVAIARLVDCIRCLPEGHYTPSDNDPELQFGDYTPGRFMWFLEDIRPVAGPIPCRGYQGLWTVPLDVAAIVSQRLAGVAL